MAISLDKTLQTVEYSLYILPEFILVLPTLAVVKMKAYQSQGYYDDKFVHIVERVENISDAATCSAIYNGYYMDYASCLTALQNYLINNISWYSGGSVV